MPIKTYKKEIKKSLPFNPNQLPPQDIEAEQSVLGALLIDKDAVIKIADIITAKDFYRRTHEIIFESMMELYAKSEPIDLLTVSSKLKEKKQFKDIGGMSYLTTLVNFVPTASNVAHYAKIVNQKRVLRDLISASGEISALAWNETGNIDEILDEAEKRIFGVSQTSLIQEFQHIKPHLTEAFERFDRLHKGDDVWRGIPTGFLDLDKRLAGLQKADLIILAARPSLGKTSLALDIARHAAVNEKMAVGVFSLEMSKQQLIERLIAAEANVDLCVFGADLHRRRRLAECSANQDHGSAAAGGKRPRSFDHRLFATDAGNWANRKPNAGSQRNFKIPKKSGERIEYSGDGPVATFTRAGGARRSGPETVGFKRIWRH
ncbi:MAG: Replicative DNA helicase [Candidatus Azambacteria bacterium GW2011_GWB1_42_72]|nr:MAG: Replicative DNA helicase [Candidatus Azambacteria bacterium GW2011_GWB1_42_72]